MNKQAYVISPSVAPQSKPSWGTQFKNADLRSIRDNAVQGRYIESEGRVSLITRSGFELNHIFTNQIASM